MPDTSTNDALPEPPTTKYRYTLVIHGNSHIEIERELLAQTRGGYMLDSDYLKRDTFDCWGGRTRTTLEHTNPEQTPEAYEAELDAWWQARKAARSENAAQLDVGDTGTGGGQ